MNDLHHADWHAGISRDAGCFSLTGALPILCQDERPDYFRESMAAHDQYLAHRSAKAPSGTTTYHAVHQADEVAGFISFRVAQEDDDETSRIFCSVEYIYVMQKFRMRRLSTMLLSPLIEKVQEVLHRATRPGVSPKVCLYSSSQPESAGGSRVLHTLEQQLVDLTKCCVGVDFFGRHLEHPPSVRERLWAHHIREELTP